MDKFLRYLKGKSIHIIGVTGAEGSNILRFLTKHNISNLTAHDFIPGGSIEKSFKLWHKGISVQEKDKFFKIFLSDLTKVTFYSDNDYLKHIVSADIVFVPQSWRLYKDKNLPLFEVKKKNIPFYSLTRLYLDWAPAKVIAVTGTVGKGSVANILFQLLHNSGKKVYFAGNETWMLQIADKLDEMKKQETLILEVSHRQLQDGFSRAPQIVLFTNLYPNHLDEVTWEEYKRLKFSLAKTQKPTDVSILNFDSPELRELANILRQKMVFYSEKNKNMNTKNIRKIYDTILSTKNAHYPINILAAATAADILGINYIQIRDSISKISALPARLEYIGSVAERNFYDDIKSTTPWATIAGIKKLGPGVILICGGKTKGIDYHKFADEIKKLTKYIVLLQSQLSRSVAPYLPEKRYRIVADLQDALELAYSQSEVGDKILVSPAAGFFYSNFIKGQVSLRKLITSLPPKEQLLVD